jgi:ActR/RegA family two-component response regulator
LTSIRSQTDEGKPRRKILVADDDAAFACGLKAVLSRDFSVEVVCEADALIERLAIETPEIMIIEPNLPGRNWFSLLEQIRPFFGAVTSLVVTGYCSRAMSDFLRAADVFAVMQKPTSVHLVRRILDFPAKRENLETPFARREEDRTLERLIWEHTNAVLASCAGNMSQTAHILGIPRQTLYRRLRKYPAVSRTIDAFPCAGDDTELRSTSAGYD